MRQSVLLTVSAGAIAAALGLALPAAADTTISSSTTSAVATSSTGNLTLASGGEITLTSGTAITVDSDNTLDLVGEVNMSASDSGSTAVLIGDVANRTQALTIGGTIYVSDDYTATDSTSADGSTDGIVDGGWAEGTGRYGIHSVGSNPFVGDVDITSAIDVEGNSSYGIRWENQIDGAFTYTGSTTLIGDNSTGISLEGGVTGNVHVGGSISVTGQDSSAIKLSGDIGGNLIIQGTYTGTAYSTTYVLTQSEYANLIASRNLEQDGPLVTLAGNVSGGVLFGAAYTDTDSSNTDEDGDGQTDSGQTTATLTQYGSAPALLVGSSSQDITFGGLTYASTALDAPAYNYGLIVRGSISAYGVHPGLTSNAIQLGGTGYNVTIDNGFQMAGTVTSTALGADTTAIALESGLSTPRLDIDGSIEATSTEYTTSSTTNDVTTYSTTAGTAYAVDIASGASLPTLTVGANHGVYAVGYGSASSATAIRDRSNSLTSITNNGIISASITATDANDDGVADTVTGSATAIDASSNTVGLTITQVDTGPDDDTITEPYILGNILLGSGNDYISSSGGYIDGDISYGAGTGGFTLSSGAAYLGKMTSSGDIAMDIDGSSSADFLVGTSVDLSSLHVGDGSKIVLTLDTSAPTTPIFVDSGTATFDNGSHLWLTTDKIVTDPTTFTVMTASKISLGDMPTTTLDGYIPYLYHASLTTDSTDTTLYASFRLKTQAEGGYSSNEYAALLPILKVVAEDSGATTSLVDQTTKSGFDSVYEQYLPDYSGETLMTLSLGSQSLNKSLGDLTVIPEDGGSQYWLQEYGYQTHRDYGETAGFKSSGFSFAGGRERPVFGNNMLGVYMQMTSSSPRDSFAIAKEIETATDYSLGAYWRYKGDAFKAWAHAGAGFDNFHTVRQLLTAYVDHIARAGWSGYSVSGGAGASYQFNTGAVSITPQWLADYYALNEMKHSESGGGDYFDLDIAKRTGHILSSTAMVNVGYNQAFVKPELWLGYKQNISATIGNTIANFTGGDAFTLTGGNIQGGGPIGGFRVSVDNPYSYFALETSYEKTKGYSNASFSLRTRFQF